MASSRPVCRASATTAETSVASAARTMTAGRRSMPPTKTVRAASYSTSPGAITVCDVDGITADAVTVDALARLQLAAGRHQCRVRLRGASPELRQLVTFMGLRDVLPG